MNEPWVTPCLFYPFFFTSTRYISLLLPFPLSQFQPLPSVPSLWVLFFLSLLLFANLPFSSHHTHHNSRTLSLSHSHASLSFSLSLSHSLTLALSQPLTLSPFIIRPTTIHSFLLSFAPSFHTPSFFISFCLFLPAKRGLTLPHSSYHSSITFITHIPSPYHRIDTPSQPPQPTLC
jgi:hypothetical protein